MTTYRTTHSSTMADADGYVETAVFSESFGKTLYSSENISFEGPTAIDGVTGVEKPITASNLMENDIITIDGIPMTAAQAESIGIDLSSLATTPALKVEEAVSETEIELTEGSSVSSEELTSAALAIDAVQLHAGLDREAAVELGVDILTGELSPSDPVFTALEQRGIGISDMLATVNMVKETATKAARRELGVEQFEELQAIAASNPAVNDLILRYGQDRLLGKARSTWSDILNLARRA